LPRGSERLEKRAKEIGFVLNYLILASAFISQMGGYNMPAAPPAPRPERLEKPAPAAKPAAPQPVVVAVPGRQLKDLPNTTIQYYDVTGKNLKAIDQSITEAQQKKDASGKTVLTTSAWAVDATFIKHTQNGVCKVDSATATFKAIAMMPRLATEQELKSADQVVWHNYLAMADAAQAATLWFAHDHARDVEQAILASTCDGAQAAGAAAKERLRTQVAEFQRTYATAHAPAPAPATTPPPK
jgi:predicted secreted Zn-dependent protease